MFSTRYTAKLILLLGLLLLPLAAMAQSGQVIITDTNAANFPDVTVNFRVPGATALTAADVQVQEDGATVTSDRVSLNSDDNAPMTTAFLIDKGELTAYNAYINAMANAMRRLQPNFKDGIDTVIVLVREGDETRTLFGPSQDFASFSSWIDSTMQASGTFGNDQHGPTDSFQGVTDTLNTLNNAGNVQAGPTIVLWFARVITDEATEDSLNRAAQLANSLGVPVHTMHTLQYPETFQGNLRSRMQQLSQLTNGQYYLMPFGGDHAPTIDGIYAPLNNARQQYTLSYRSQSSSSSERTVTISAAGTTGTTTYTSNVSPLNVTIALPNLGGDNVLDRGVTVDIDEVAEQVTKTYQVSSTTVTGAVSFGGGAERGIESATLYVNEVPLTPLFNPDPNYFEFNWSVDTFTERGDFPNTLRIEILDEFGDTYSSGSEIVTVRLDFPEDIPTEFVTVENQCELDPTSAACRTELARDWIPVATTIVSVLVAAILAWQLRQTRAMQAVGGAVMTGVGALATGVGQVRKTLVGGAGGGGAKPPSSGSLYRLQVKQGPPGSMNNENVGMTIDISNHELSIGRASGMSDLRFYGSMVESSVSRKHCTIRYDAARNRFMIRDEGSSAGTAVNGQRIQGREVEITAGAMIEIGQADNNGVVLEFMPLNSPSGMPAPVMTGVYQQGMATSVGHPSAGGAAPRGGPARPPQGGMPPQGGRPPMPGAPAMGGMPPQGGFNPARTGPQNMGGVSGGGVNSTQVQGGGMGRVRRPGPALDPEGTTGPVQGSPQRAQGGSQPLPKNQPPGWPNQGAPQPPPPSQSPQGWPNQGAPQPPPPPQSQPQYGNTPTNVNHPSPQQQAPQPPNWQEGTGSGPAAGSRRSRRKGASNSNWMEDL